MPYDIAIEGGRIVTEDEIMNATLVIDNGHIVDIVDPGKEIKVNNTIDASGKHVLPGGVDPHVHMMDPGYTHRETFETGTAAAAAGGITTVGEHHRTTPPVLNKRILIEKKKYLENKTHVDFGLLAGGHPDNIDKIAELAEAGTLAIKSFTCEVHGVPPVDTADLLKLFDAAKLAGLKCMIHPEDNSILQENRKQLIDSGINNGDLIPLWRSKEAEAVAVATTLELAYQTGVAMWFAHVSHPALIDNINYYRERGADVYVETCPQYLYLTEEDVEENAPYTMFTPPARSQADQDELWNRLASGEIDMINADHAPTTAEEKRAGEADIFKSPFGIPGIEFVLPLLLNGYNEDRVTLERISEVFSTNPAKILGLYPKKGVIQINADADLVIIDLNKSKKISNKNVVSKCGWTPYEGMQIKGIPELTLVRGNLVYNDGEIVSEPGIGRFVSPS